MKKSISVLLIAILLCTMIVGCGKKINPPADIDVQTPEIEQGKDTGEDESSPSEAVSNRPAGNTTKPIASTTDLPSEKPAGASHEERKARLLSYAPVNDYRDLDKIGFNKNAGYDNEKIYNFIKAFVENDTKTLEEVWYLKKGTYDIYKTIELSGYSLCWVEHPQYADFPVRYADPFMLLTFNIAKSGNELLPPGEHTYMVGIDEIGLLFLKHGELRYSDYTSPAYDALSCWNNCTSLGIGGWDGIDIPDIEARYKEDINLGSDVLTHLITNKRLSEKEFLTEEQVVEKAKIHFGIFDFEPNRQPPTVIEGEYRHMGHDSLTPSHDVVSEEVIDGVTVLTIQYYADLPKTVYSDLIEYRFIVLDDGVRFLPSKTIKESPFEVAFFGV